MDKMKKDGERWEKKKKKKSKTNVTHTYEQVHR